MRNSTLPTLAAGQLRQRPFRRQFLLAAAITAIGANLMYALMLEVAPAAVAGGIVCLFALAVAVAISWVVLQDASAPTRTASTYSRLGALASAFFATSALFSGMLFLGVGMVAIALDST